jgi:hypothetical protein
MIVSQKQVVTMFKILSKLSYGDAAYISDLTEIKKLVEEITNQQDRELFQFGFIELEDAESGKPN